MCFLVVLTKLEAMKGLFCHLFFKTILIPKFPLLFFPVFGSKWQRRDLKISLLSNSLKRFLTQFKALLRFVSIEHWRRRELLFPVNRSKYLFLNVSFKLQCLKPKPASLLVFEKSISRIPCFLQYLSKVEFLFAAQKVVFLRTVNLSTSLHWFHVIFSRSYKKANMSSHSFTLFIESSSTLFSFLRFP